MNRSTFCEIKYMNRLGFIKGWVYDWDWFQNCYTDSHTSTKITLSPPTLSLKLFTLYVNCVQLYYLLQVVLIMLNGWVDEILPRASLQQWDTPNCVCNVGDRSYVHPTNEHTIFRTPVDLNLEQIMSMLVFQTAHCNEFLKVCHFPIGILGQVWYLIVSIPDLCTITYFYLYLE